MNSKEEYSQYNCGNSKHTKIILSTEELFNTLVKVKNRTCQECRKNSISDDCWCLTCDECQETAQYIICYTSDGFTKIRLVMI